MGQSDSFDFRGTEQPKLANVHDIEDKGPQQFFYIKNSKIDLKFNALRE